MKQKSKNILHVTFHLALFIGVILAVSTVHQNNQPDKHQTKTKTAESSNTKKHAEKKKSSLASASKSSTKVAANNPYTPEKIKLSVAHEYIYRIFNTPNDPEYSSTDWAYTQINAEAAWDITSGDGSTVVAVIDSGFALNHEDLINQWHQNTGETGNTQSGDICWTGSPEDKSANDCDDDANGYVDDWRGWNFVLNDNDPQTGRDDPSGDGARHGTQVSGLIGASGNNSTGIAALNWNTEIMPLQALDDDGVGYTSDVAAGIYYAVDNGADVINLSLGSYSDDPAVKTAVEYAVTNDVVVVAAAGNCGNGGSDCTGIPKGKIGYPAEYPDVIAVGASTSSSARAGFSSYGPALDVLAPGNAVPRSTSWSQSNPDNTYSTNLYGTSFSSPIVSSLAALIKSIRPDTSVADIASIIDGTASKPSGMNGILYNEYFGHGIIDAETALTISSSLNSTTDMPALLQAGTSKKEHFTTTSRDQYSGCETAAGNPCTIQFYQPDDGYTRYLPYQIAGADGAGWIWKPALLDTNLWEVRARIGENINDTPYILIKKG